LLDDVRCVNVYKQLATEVPLIVFQSPTTSYLEEWPATEYPVGGFNPSEKYELVNGKDYSIYSGK